MRILLASSSSGSRGGGEIFLRYLVHALEAKGHQVGLWMADHQRMDELAAQCLGSAEILRSPYQNTYDLRGRSLTALLHRSNRNSARRSWQDWKPDVIQINKQNLEDGLDLMGAAKELPIPTVCTIHITQTANYLKASNARLRDFLSRFVLRRYGGTFTTVADSRKSELEEFIGNSSRIRCVYNGTPAPDRSKIESWRSDKRAALGLTEDQILVTMVGRMTAQKSPDIFLERAKEILKTHPNHRFLWVGNGDYEESWDRQCAAKPLRDKVFRLPWEKEVLPWLAATDAYLHTAAYEGLPLAIIEALSMGKPCFLNPGMIHEVHAFHHQSCLVALDPEGLWINELTHQHTLNEKGIAARKLYDSHFRVETMASGYEQIYEEAINS